jgi:hypothetical protein
MVLSSLVCDDVPNRGVIKGRGARASFMAHPYTYNRGVKKILQNFNKSKMEIK